VKYTVVLSADPETGVVTATCPALPGLVCEAATFDEVQQIIVDLILDFVEHGEQPLPETNSLIAAEVTAVISDRDEEGWPMDIRVTSVTVPTSIAA
jgi:predicted RNase H-like HicB family nuclease